jgi:pilus assembly protein CpaE
MLGLQPEKTIYDLVVAPGELDSEKLAGYTLGHPCGLDVPTIKNVRLSLQTLDLLSFPPERVGVVLNRSNTNVGIQRAEVERALETKIRADLPSDRAVPLGVNRGKPVSLNDPGADFAKAIVELAKTVMADPGGKGKKKKAASRKGLISRMRS